jgi:hypothetical protein
MKDERDNVRWNVCYVPLIWIELLAFTVLELSGLGQALASAVAEKSITKHVSRNYFENSV